MHTYELISGGYQIFLSGRLYIDQPFDPEKPGKVSMAPEAAEAAAAALVAELSARDISD